MIRPNHSNEHRVVGSLLVDGFAFLLVAAAMFTAGTNGSAALPEWQSTALGAGLVVTLLALATFELILSDAGKARQAVTSSR